jgi:hypothetical protein
VNFKYFLTLLFWSSALFAQPQFNTLYNGEMMFNLSTDVYQCQETIGNFPILEKLKYRKSLVSETSQSFMSYKKYWKDQNPIDDGTFQCSNYLASYSEVFGIKKSDNYLQKLKKIYQHGKIIVHHTATSSKFNAEETKKEKTEKELQHAKDLQISQIKREGAKRNTDGEIMYHPDGTEQLDPKTRRSPEYLDLAYHFLIDKLGNVYEGRPLHIIGGHAGASRMSKYKLNGEDIETTINCLTNKGRTLKVNFTYDMDFMTIGIGLMGDFSKVEPSGFQLNSLVTLIRYLNHMFGIKKIIPHIYSKPEGQSTECPGPGCLRALARLFEKGDFVIPYTQKFQKATDRNNDGEEDMPGINLSLDLIKDKPDYQRSVVCELTCLEERKEVNYGSTDKHSIGFRHAVGLDMLGF